MLIMDTTTLEQLQAQVRERVSRIRDHEEAAVELKSLQDALREVPADDIDWQCHMIMAWLEMTKERHG